MFTPIDLLSRPVQQLVLESLDVPAEWETTWDIGLTDVGDSYPVRPLWGRVPVDGRWPAAFPLGHRQDPRPWRQQADAPDGHVAPHRALFDLDSIGIRSPAGARGQRDLGVSWSSNREGSGPASG